MIAVAELRSFLLGAHSARELPDRITLNKNNMQEHGADLDALRKRVHITLVHDIGH
ncbi:metallopeptidase family protein [Microbacterium sp. P5_E9]